MRTKRGKENGTAFPSPNNDIISGHLNFVNRYVVPGFCAVAPVVIVPVFRILSGRGADKPGALIGAVVYWQINDHPYPPLMGGGQQGFHVFKTAVLGVDLIIVCHIVLVGAGRRHDGHEPDSVKAHAGNIVQLFRHAIQVTDTVAFAVTE